MILVTGGAGYIGSHICIELLAAGYEVVIFDNFSNSTLEVIPRLEKISGKKVNVIVGNLCSPAEINQIFDQFAISAVIHCAGLKSIDDSIHNPMDYYHNNAIGTYYLLKAMEAHHVFRLIFSSSATVYGIPQQLPISEEHPLSATNPYGRTKIIIEEMLRDLLCASPLWKIGILRYFNPVGAHESGLIGENPLSPPGNLMPLVSQVALGKLKALKIYGNDYSTPDGTGLRDYIHIMDVASAHLKAIEALDSIGYFVVNLGTGQGYSVLELINQYALVAQKKISFEIADRRTGDVAACYANPGLAKRLLGWEARRNLHQMCEDAWRWQSRNPTGYNSPSA